MKTVRFVAWILPLAIVVLGCERRQAGSDRVTSPITTPAVHVTGARWVWDKDLDLAVRAAATSPLVQRTLAESPHPGASPLWSKAVRAEGRVSDGSDLSVTILPFAVGDDPTHAMFLSVIERNGEKRVEPSELIVGRRPGPGETGFEPMPQGDETIWVKTGDAYVTGEAGPYRLSGERIKWGKFFQCFMQRAPGYCATGAELGGQLAPQYPQSRAIGCGLGLAVAAGECALTSR